MQNLSRHIGTLTLKTPIILAPMAGITSLPYRRIMKPFGAGLVVTEMVSANGLIRDGVKTRELLATAADEAPLAVQLFGDDPAVLSRAAQMLDGDEELLDINMGCPVKKVVRSGAGSALLKDPVRVGNIIAAVRKAYPKPLTAKIRSGWDAQSINYLEIGRILESEGADAVTLHPRTRSQGFAGQADWDQITQLKSALSIPVYGSGDICCAADASRMMSQTGCDGIMLGRGCYGNPWLIGNCLRTLQNLAEIDPKPEDVLKVALQHLELHRQHFGERKALFEMRKHLSWYTKGFSGSSAFRAGLQTITSCRELEDKARKFFAEVISA